MFQETRETPTLTVPAALSEGSYTAICLDLDAPFISFNPMSPVAHWIQTDLRASAFSKETMGLTSDKLPLGPWVPAGPPPGAAPHRYLIILYKQQSTSSPITEPYCHMQRIRVDTNRLTKQLGLEKIVAANYYVSN